MRFFDSIDHGWLLKFVEHRIADRKVLRLIQKWLSAGILENGKWSETRVGTPQGATISPLLANMYLHYVFDLWVEHWRKQQTRGDVIVVRYADDIVLGFQYEKDATRFRQELAQRMRKFGLELHPEKTRLLRFGRFAAADRRERGEGKPETFDFLGFTHICGKTKLGKFLLERHTAKARMRARVAVVKEEIRQRRHLPVREQGKWLGSVVRGYFAYHAVPTNSRKLDGFRTQVIRHWYKALRRRGQRRPITWKRMYRLAKRWIPPARILHPYPDQRFIVRTQGRSRVR